MTRKSIKIIAISAGISLLGLVLTQVVWITRSWKIKENQFDHRADMVLDDVIEELEDYTDSSFRASHFESDRMLQKEKRTIFDAIDTIILDTLLKKYSSYHRLDNDYFFAIIRTADDTIIYSSQDYKKYKKHKSYKACLSCLWKEEYYHLSIIFPFKSRMIFVELLSWLVLSVLFLFIIVFSFGYTIHTILKQKRLTDIKNDFINNMTHEFKTPISTISIASEVLLQNNPKSSRDNVRKYAGIIFDENARMKRQVEQVLETAQQEKGEIKLNFSLIDMHELIKNVVDNLCIEKCEKEVKVNYLFVAQHFKVNVDKLHFTNVINNIVENAIKYCNKYLKLNISTKNRGDKLIISFEDNGVGIPSKSLKYIFDKFYRVPSGDIHDVKGFGLGLYYVKHIVKAHSGDVEVVNEVNKGSRFDVSIPIE